jgi:FHA domain
MLATQNITAILRPLQWLVIALIFLFFLRVIRAVWVEVRPAGARAGLGGRRRGADAPASPSIGRRAPLVLTVMEPEESRGQVFELDDELTVGRSPGCGISTSYDVYSSTLHARLFRRGDQLWVEDLGSTNGTYVNSERISAPIKLGKGDIVQIGGTVFEVSR